MCKTPAGRPGVTGWQRDARFSDFAVRDCWPFKQAPFPNTLPQEVTGPSCQAGGGGGYLQMECHTGGTPPPPTKGMEREGVVRGRWAPRPMEGEAQGKEREVEREG